MPIANALTFLSWATSKENRLENQNPILNLHFFAFYNSQGSEKLKIKWCLKKLKM